MSCQLHVEMYVVFLPVHVPTYSCTREILISVVHPITTKHICHLYLVVFKGVCLLFTMWRLDTIPPHIYIM